MNTDECLQKGADGEAALNTWFNEQGLGFVHVSQSRETFATLFTDVVKRPDFLLLFDSIGLLAVDAKNKDVFDGWVNGIPIDGDQKLKRKGRWVSLDDERSELRKALSFERILRIPFWYAFLVEEDAGEKWYWISALKALEVGLRVQNKKEKTEFLDIALDECVCISEGDDLGKLYLQRTSLKVATNQ